MDIVTQGIAGATCAQLLAPKRHQRVAALAGLGAGLLPDADALINSASDPLLQLEFHRHFSHALIFIPLGAMLATVLMWPLLRRFLSIQHIYYYCICGYATGGLLDACTSYGTHLYWPFSSQPIAWNLIAIVDPIFTLALAIPLIIGLKRSQPARLGLILALVYLLCASIQHQRAKDAAFALAQQRNHIPQHLVVKPTIANLVLWRTIYIVNDSIWVDAVRVGRTTQIYVGTHQALFDPRRDLSWAPKGSPANNNAKRFVAFTGGLTVSYAGPPQWLGDARYAMLPTAIAPLWGIEFNTNTPDTGLRWRTNRAVSTTTRRYFFTMLLGGTLTP